MQPIAIRPLPPDIWNRPAVAYSGYRAGQNPSSDNHPSREEILEDLRLLREEGFGLIRLFSAGVQGRRVLELMAEHNLDLKVQLGAYVRGSDADNHAYNQRELDNVIDLANRFSNIVAGVSIGNEILVSWSFVAVPPEDVIRYIRYARSRIPQPVTVNDNWEPYAVATDQPKAAVWAEIDYACIHTYAYWDAAWNTWDSRQEAVAAPARDGAIMDAALAYAKQNFAAARRALDEAGRAIPIVIGETGWQTKPTAHQENAHSPDFAQRLAGPENQARYYRDLVEWVYGPNRSARGDGFERPAGLFYFSAFDEPWKQADDNWGLWDAERNRKPVLDP